MKQRFDQAPWIVLAGLLTAAGCGGGGDSDPAAGTQGSSGSGNGTASDAADGSGGPAGPGGDPAGPGGTGSASSVTSPDSTTASTTADEGGSTEGVAPEDFDDEFDDPDALASWTLLHEVEGAPAPYRQLDIGESNAGQLTIVPNAGGWFDDYAGPFLFKLVSGDFVVEVSVAANRSGQTGGPPERLYNSAGVMVRDPASGDGRENWVIHNVGRQSREVGVATEGKTTVNSQSTLMLNPGTWSGRLRLCRVGSQFILTRRLADENQWTQTHAYERPEMPHQVQLGMMVNGWNSNESTPDFSVEPDIVATFDYIRMWRPDGTGSCTQE